MCYMEQKMQEQMKAGFALEKELGEQYERFCQWYLSTFPDGDETLIDIKYLDERYYLKSPVSDVSAAWLGWRSALGI